MTILRRDVSFDFADVPRDWCGDDPYRTTFLDALSLLFPEGERFFVESVKQHKPDIASPELQRDIAGFIGQEAMHGREHRAFNEMLVAHGFTAAPGIDRRLGKFLRMVRRSISARSQLAATCALEHFTAIMAERILADEAVRADFHPSMRSLWLWHALEESEHKAVAFDVYVASGGGYVRRVVMMMVTTAIFFAAQGMAHAHLMAQRKILWKPWRWLRGIKRLWLAPGWFLKLVPAYFAYYKPGFHPDDRDTTALLDDWKQRFEPGYLAAGAQASVKMVTK